MTYAEAIEFLYDLRLFGAEFGLETTFKLAALMGNPQDNLRFIHVAGTNGKGSTCAMLESIYRAAGQRTGLFTSPHLVSFRERIQVNRELIPEAEVVRYIEELQPLLKQFSAHHPTFFEVVTVMALKFFAAQQCDLVIWETGLGGRLDATNIVTPLASVITNIAFDHQQWLGDTLGKIAREKAGIIKPGVPIITATDQAEALAVIEAVAREKNAPLIKSGPLPAPLLSDEKPSLPPLSLAGKHQELNAALALATVATLQNQIPVRAENISTGLANVNWPGRLQWIQLDDGRRLLLDGAHNIAGMETLRTALETMHPTGERVVIFGALKDKSWTGLCHILAPWAGKIYTVPVASERTADAHELATACRAANPMAIVTPQENLVAALNACKNAPVVVVTGSLYLVGEMLELAARTALPREERGLNEWKAVKK